MLDHLKEQFQAAITEAKAIRATAAADDRDLNDDEIIRIDALTERAEGLQTEIADASAAADRRARALSALDRLDSDSTASRGAKSRQLAVDADGSDVTVVADAIDRDPNRGFRSPAAFLNSVISFERAAASGRSVEQVLSSEPGLRYLAAAGTDEQSTFSDAFGGFLVPEGFSPDMHSVTAEADPIGNRVTRIPMEFPTVSFPARVDKTHTSSVSGGLTVSRRAEADTSSSSRQQYEKVSLNATSLFGLAYATEEILSDSPVSFAALIAAGFRDEFASVILDERLNGTGVGEFLGVNNAGCLVSQAKETNQAADTIVYENVLNMRSRCWGYQNAVWLANHDCLPQIALLNQSVGTGGVPVFMPSAREDVPDMLLGRPLVFTEYAETLGDAGDIVCGNWTQFLEGVYEPLQSAESVHVRFINHERAFKFWMRNAGTPWWSAALTPKNSSTTLSPFVTLAERA
jgi:HK97 family phage major capsid protein